MRTYKPRKHRSKEEQAKINAEVAKRKAKRFKINGSNQNVWIPNCYLEDDGTIKANMNIDFVFRKSVNQLNKAGITQAIIGIKRKTPEADALNLKSAMQKNRR